MLRFALPAAFTVLAASPALAEGDAAADAEALFELMKLPQIISVMQQEGIAYGETLGEDMLAGNTGPDWMRMVGRIYDEERMVDRIRTEFVQGLEGADLAALHGFYGSELGQELLSLELSAREAFLDEAVEDAARENAAVAMADETDRYQLVARFVEANDLVERNVMGAMNSNYAFFQGLAEGGAFGGDLSEDQILADVWAQEPEIRANTTEWVFAFSMLAYQPLGDEALERYVAFSESKAGQSINRVLFESFDGEFEEISHALGRAAAHEMTAQDL